MGERSFGSLSIALFNCRRLEAVLMSSFRSERFARSERNSYEVEGDGSPRCDGGPASNLSRNEMSMHGARYTTGVPKCALPILFSLRFDLGFQGRGPRNGLIRCPTRALRVVRTFFLLFLLYKVSPRDYDRVAFFGSWKMTSNSNRIVALAPVTVASTGFQAYNM